MRHRSAQAAQPVKAHLGAPLIAPVALRVIHVTRLEYSLARLERIRQREAIAVCCAEQGAIRLRRRYPARSATRGLTRRRLVHRQRELVCRVHLGAIPPRWARPLAQTAQRGRILRPSARLRLQRVYRVYLEQVLRQAHQRLAIVDALLDTLVRAVLAAPCVLLVISLYSLIDSKF